MKNMPLPRPREGGELGCIIKNEVKTTTILTKTIIKGKEMATFRALQGNIFLMIFLLGLMCLIEVINHSMGHSLNHWGITPHQTKGLIGILFTPFLHANFNHLLINIIAISILGGVAALSGYKTFYNTTFLTIILSGLAAWAIGQHTNYLGAGALVFGYFGLILMRASVKHHLIIFLLAILTMATYVAILLGYTQYHLPSYWDYHLSALGVGIIYGYLHMR